MNSDVTLPVRARALLDWARGTGGGAALAVRQVRDLSVVDLIPGLLLVTACDSDGSIGPKPADQVRVSAYHIGRFGARVALMELLACGARPFLLLDTLAVEMDPTGREIIAAVRDEAAAAGLDDPAAVNGSTEDNVPTQMTGMGVTALGLCAADRFRPGTARRGDLVVCIGRRKSGPEDEIVLADPELMDLPALRALLPLAGVRDILPVGSHGIAHEAGQMAAAAGLAFVSAPDPGVDLIKSAGPGTCCLCAADPAAVANVRAATGKPCFIVGELISP